MESEEKKDDLLRPLMAESYLTLPFSDFELRTLARISAERVAHDSTRSDRRLAHVFFLLGLLSGLAIAVLFLGADGRFEGLATPSAKWVAQAVIALALVLLGNVALRKFKTYLQRV